MATRRQRRAFRKNAKRSTGPHTTEGKARSSHDARQHGLFARDTLLPGEDPQEFLQLSADLAEELDADSAFECRLVHHIADTEWRRLFRDPFGPSLEICSNPFVWSFKPFLEDPFPRRRWIMPALVAAHLVISRVGEANLHHGAAVSWRLPRGEAATLRESTDRLLKGCSARLAGVSGLKIDFRAGCRLKWIFKRHYIKRRLSSVG